ncbi:transcriptional regulator [Spirochaetia bacterium]|nr:transcriptional regulator [Spirochaetia bacterium]
MGFKENLKAELEFSGMLIKELAARSGVNRRTIDNYLSTYKSQPSAENAVKIARALGVSVEYLVTGNDKPRREKTLAALSPDLRVLVQTVEQLDEKHREFAFTLINDIKTHAEAERNEHK